ncbi:MAG: PAS domain S-box protein, partial [Oxalobacteraceae bacterium]
QGAFLGVIVAPINAERMASMFELARFGLDDNITIALVHQDGKMIARAPQFKEAFATNISNSDVYRQINGVSKKTFKVNSAVNGKPLISSFLALGNRPLAVFVAVSVQSLNHALREDLLISAAGIVLLVAILFLSAQVALHSYRNLEMNKQALQESELRWKFALEGAGDGVWNWDTVTDEAHLSPRWKQILGYAENEFEDTFDGWKNRIHPDDTPRVMAEYHACLKGKTPVYISEYRMLCKDGSWKWVLGRGLVINRDAAGRALRMIGTLTDISGRKQDELLQLHKIIDAAPGPMLLVANDGIIIYANRAAQSAFGYPRNELMGQNVDKLVPLRSRSSHVRYRKNFETSRTQHPSDVKRPLNAVRKDGTEFPVEISLSPFQMDGQAVVIASIRDITERKQAAELLQQSFAQLRRLSDHQQNLKEDERKRIAQDIHDDLGQNLLALKMDVDTLYARTGNAHPRLHTQVGFALKNIIATIQSVKSIINDLRPAALELGLYPAVKWQLKQFERRNAIACILATIEPEPEFGLDDGQTLAVFRIFQESLANIARHARATEVEIALNRDESGFTMQVKDNGKGLQPGDRRKANSFGLIGIKERIHSLGGKLVIASNPGNGTVLSISIPLDGNTAEA